MNDFTARVLTEVHEQCTIVLFVQLENPDVLRQLQGQDMTESQRQTVADLFEQTLPEAAFDPTLYARYVYGLAVVKGYGLRSSIALNGKPISELRSVTCRMGSHSVTYTTRHK